MLTSGKNVFEKWIYLAVLSLIWGSSFILIKKGLTGFGYVEAATIRLMSAALVFCPWGFYLVRTIPRKKLSLVFLTSVLSMFIPSYLFCIAQQQVSSSVAGMLNALTPLCTFIVAVFMFKRPFSKLQVVGLILGFIASAILMFNTSTTVLAINPYALFIVLATIGYGFHINFVSHYLSDVPSLSISAVAVTMAGLLAFCFVYIPTHEKYQFTPDNFNALVCLLILGVFGTAIAQFLNNKIIAISSSLFASTSTYVIPIVAVFWGINDGEQLTWVHLLSMIGVLAAIIFIRQDKKLSLSK